MLPILIVDDEPAIAALISRVLTAAGYTCPIPADAVPVVPD